MRIAALFLLISTSAWGTSTDEQALFQANLDASRVASPSKELSLSCIPSPLPASASGRIHSGTFTWSAGETAKVEIWRAPCSGNDAQLYVTMTPTAGSPFVCGPQITILQNGLQMDGFGLFNVRPVGGVTSFCDDLLIKQTFVMVDRFNHGFDDDKAFTFVMKGVSVTLRGEIPAWTPGGGTPAVFEISELVEGTWFTPGLDGQGLIVDVDPGSKVMVAGWYMGKPDGSGLDWVTGVGPYLGQLAALNLIRNHGVRVGQTSPVTQSAAGNAIVQFESCTTGSITYTLTGSPQQELPLQRLTPPPAGCQ